MAAALLVILALVFGFVPATPPAQLESTTARMAVATAPTMPCDPGGGYPKPSSTCPDATPETGNLTRQPDGTLRFKPFRTYFNDAEGKAYAKKHRLHFPFDNDHYDAPAGPAYAVSLSGGEVCTGIILVKRTKPMHDQVVPCSRVTKAAGKYSLPTAIWREGDRIVQVSELFRP